VDGAALLCGRGVCGCIRFVEGKQTFVLDRRREFLLADYFLSGVLNRAIK
jgi:hypothetical protein